MSSDNIFPITDLPRGLGLNFFSLVDFCSVLKILSVFSAFYVFTGLDLPNWNNCKDSIINRLAVWIYFQSCFLFHLWISVTRTLAQHCAKKEQSIFLFMPLNFEKFFRIELFSYIIQCLVRIFERYIFLLLFLYLTIVCLY